MRILELFSGIGAVAHAIEGQHEIVAAIDINELAMQVYRANFSSSTIIQEITSLTDKQLRAFQADVWWMSPPCQPFTRRGKQRDIDDPRTKPLLHMIQAIERVRPDHIAIENVIGFTESQTFELLIETLSRCGYQYSHTNLCSSQFRLPNLRPRFFMVASRLFRPNLKPPHSATENEETKCDSVSGFLEDEDRINTWVTPIQVEADQLHGYRHAINIVHPDSNMTRCFTSAYGHSIVRSGSYLQIGNQFRRFSPREEARLLGFSDRFRLPENMSTRQLWKLLGNSVSIPCVQHIFSAFED